MKLLAAALLLSASAQAKTLRVAADGTGDHQTFETALDAAKDGDVIEMAGRGFLGMGINKDSAGFFVSEIVPNSPTQAAGVAVGERLLKVDGGNPGETVLEAVTKLRGDADTTVRVTLGNKAGAERELALTRALRRHEIKGDFSKSVAATREGSIPHGIKYAERCAKDGSKDCMRGLMWTYWNETSGYRDDEKSYKWARKLADLDDADGQHLTGYFLHIGRGVAKDVNEGYKWSLRAAHKGNKYAQGLVASDLAYGTGTSKNYALAEEWFTKAIAAGNEYAKKSYDDWKAYVKAEVEADARARNSAQNQPAANLSSHLATHNAAHAAAVAAAQLAAGQVPARAPAPAPGVSREELKAMMAEALREQKASEPKPETPTQASSAADAPRYSKPERPSDLAVVIGIEKYSSVPEATYAERDALAVAAHLKALGFPERNIFTLTGTRATKSAFLKELETRLSRLTKPDSTVFVYFSGHGAPDPKSGDAYLMPYDGDPEFLEDTGYPLKRLYAKLSALKAKRVIVALDSCFSGAGGRSVLAKGVRPLVASVEPAQTGRVLALTAAKGSEISGAADGQGHGLFTYHLLSALNAGKTTLGELHGYLKTRVADEARRGNRDQTPQLIGAGAASEDLGK